MKLAVPGYLENLSSSLHQLQQANRYCNVSIATRDGQYVPAHSVVLLGSGSPVLHQILQSRAYYQFLIVDDFQHESLGVIQNIIESLYTGHVEVTADNAKMLTRLYRLLQLDKFAEVCDELILNHGTEGCTNFRSNNAVSDKNCVSNNSVNESRFPLLQNEEENEEILDLQVVKCENPENWDNERNGFTSIKRYGHDDDNVVHQVQNNFIENQSISFDESWQSQHEDLVSETLENPMQRDEACALIKPLALLPNEHCGNLITNRLKNPYSDKDGINVGFASSFPRNKKGTLIEARQSQDEDSMSETAENAGQMDDSCSDNDKINREIESSFQRKKKGSNTKKKGCTKKAEKEGSMKKSTDKIGKKKTYTSKSRCRKHCKTMDDGENRALPVKASCETGESGGLPVKASCETGASTAKEVGTGESTTSVDSSVKQAVHLINQEQFIMKKEKYKPKKCAHCDKMVDDCKCPPSKLKQLKVCCYCSLRFLKCDAWYKHMNEKHGLQCPNCEFVHYR